MKRNIFIILVLLFSNFIFSKNLQYYYINGKEIIDTSTEGKTQKYIQENFFKETKFFYTHSVSKDFYKNDSGILAIIYKEFTDKPLFIIGNSVDTNQIKEALKTFDYNKYINSSNFSYKLKTYSTEKKLNKTLIYNIFGKPNNIVETKENTSFLYDKPNIIFIFKNEELIDYIHTSN